MNITRSARNGLLALLLAIIPCVMPSLVSAQAADGQWSINLRDADVRAFIDQVSVMTGKTFVVDQRVKGKITVIAPEPMDSHTVYQVFLAVLSVNGFAAVPSGNLVKIVPDANAKQDSIPLDLSLRPSGEDLITRVIALEGASATELVPVLRPLLPQSGHMAAVAGANVLVVTDRAENIGRLEDVIASIDGGNAQELEVVQLTHAWVGDVIDMLDTFSAQTGGDAGKGAVGRRAGAVNAGRVRIVADERTNRLLMRGEQNARARLLSLIRSIDVPAEANTGSVQVIRLRHAEAKKTAEILKAMIDGSSSGSSTASGGASAASALVNAAGGKVSIQADESLNALVVRAEPAAMQQIKAVVSQLDVRRAQILIEAAIVEVGGSAGKALGVQWASGDPDSGVIGSNFSGAGRSLNEIAAAIINPVAAAGLAEGITLAGGERNANGDIQFAGVLQALASSANVNLLSTPSVLTLDNKQATIIVGENVPFITGTATNTSGGVSNPFTTIQRQDVGIQLKVTPTLIDDGNVKLVIEQEVSSVKPKEDAIQSSDLITSKRSISTTVLAGTGQTVVLGGLIEDRVSETVKKVPLFGDIPVIGILFRAKNVSRGKQNLMVFLRPTLVRDADHAGELTRARYNGVRSLAYEVDSRGDIARIQERQPLPEDPAEMFRGRNAPGQSGESGAKPVSGPVQPEQVPAQPESVSVEPEPAAEVAPATPSAETGATEAVPTPVGAATLPDDAQPADSTPAAGSGSGDRQSVE